MEVKIELTDINVYRDDHGYRHIVFSANGEPQRMMLEPQHFNKYESGLICRPE